MGKENEFKIIEVQERYDKFEAHKGKGYSLDYRKMFMSYEKCVVSNMSIGERCFFDLFMEGMKIRTIITSTIEDIIRYENGDIELKTLNTVYTLRPYTEEVNSR